MTGSTGEWGSGEILSGDMLPSTCNIGENWGETVQVLSWAVSGTYGQPSDNLLSKALNSFPESLTDPWSVHISLNS